MCSSEMRVRVRSERIVYVRSAMRRYAMVSNTRKRIIYLHARRVDTLIAYTMLFYQQLLLLFSFLFIW